MKPTLVVAFLVGAPLVAFGAPKDKEARAHMAKAAKAHKEGHFEQALVELQAAYDLQPKPDLQYAIGQIYVKLGKCGEARAAYDKFLVAHKDGATAVQQALSACKEATPPPAEAAVSTAPAPAEPPPPPVAAAPPPAPEAAPPPPPPAAAPPAPPVARADSPFTEQPRGVQTRRAWYTDKLGDGLVIGGLAAGVVGIVMYRGATGKLDDAESAPTLDRYKQLVDDAHSQRTYSVILVGGGVALVGAGILHYMFADRGTESHAVGVVPASGGGVVTYGGSF